MAGIERAASIVKPGELSAIEAYKNAAKPTETGDPNTQGFVDTMKQYVHNVNELQHTSEGVFRQFVRGEAELHDVALASHESEIAMRLTSEIRNRLLASYQEVMRMQI